MSDKIKFLDNRDIDLSYNPESENAQSGKAVAEAFAGFTPIDENQLIGKKTEQGGEIFNDYENNKALAENTSVSGIGNQAGYYGFRIDSTYQPPAVNAPMLLQVPHVGDIKAYECYSVGDIIQIISEKTIYNKFYITDLSPNAPPSSETHSNIQIYYINGEDETEKEYLTLSPNENSNWCYVVGKPYGEPVVSLTASSASGSNNIAIGSCSTVMGTGNTTFLDNSLVAGQWNEVNTEALFTIGNGDSNEQRSNAFIVNKDGSAEIKTQGNTDNSIATKNYVDTRTPQIIVSSSEPELSKYPNGTIWLQYKEG